MNDSQIYFIDQTSERNHHMIFNASFVSMLIKIYQHSIITFCGIESSQSSTLSLLDAEELVKIKLSPIIYTEPKTEKTIHKLFNFIRKEIKRFFHFYQLLKRGSSNDRYFLSITTPTSFLLLKLLKILYPSRKFIAVLHGDLDFLYVTQNKFEKFTGLLYRINLAVKSSNFYYIVLNKISKNKLLQSGFVKENEIIEIDHPYLQMDGSDHYDKILNSPVHIGHIGSMERYRKNSHILYQLAKDSSSFITDHNVVFETVGLITPEMQDYKNEWVLEKVGNSKPDKPDYLTREEYESHLKNLDFTVFLYDQIQYVFRASGAFIDAVAFGIPILTYQHPYFDNLVERFGAIGYVCKDYDHLLSKVKEIALLDNNSIADYGLFRKNLSAMKEHFTVDFVAKDLKNQLMKRNLC